MAAQNALIRDCIGRINPRHLLVICPADSDLPERCEQWKPTQGSVSKLPPDAGPTGLKDKIYDLAIISDALQKIPKARGENLLARLRDVQAKHLLVELTASDIEAGWSEADMLALGLKHMKEQRKDAKSQLYEFNIATYKNTPDWLNPKYWAHPERWDQDRW